MKRRVLICGAGVTGLALAYWLDRAGFAVTVAERAPAFRRGGQAVDVRGEALKLLDAMGLRLEAEALRTRSRGMSGLNAQGEEIARTEERTFSAGRLDSDDIEIFRDDLCELFLRVLGPRVAIRYGESITALEQNEREVSVQFASGVSGHFDVLVGADGVYSQTRKLCFDREAEVVKPLGIALSLFTVPNLLDLQHWQLGHRQAQVGVIIYPSHDQQELRVGVGYGLAGNEVSRRDVAAQKAMVLQQCAHMGGLFTRVFEAMQASDEFYYNELAQIHMPAWSHGRVVLAGDAAHCASPLTGQGTSLAMVGAFVLARALAAHADDPATAFALYERRMRPYVSVNQALLDLTREGPVPDEQMDAAKHGIVLDDLLAELSASV